MYYAGLNRIVLIFVIHPVEQMSEFSGEERLFRILIKYICER